MKSFSDMLPPKTIVTDKDYFKTTIQSVWKLTYGNILNTDLFQKSTESH